MAVNRMLRFVTVKRDMPSKRAADERREDFGEIYREFAAEKAAEQAGRCSQCGVPYCQTHCPLHNNIPDWLKLTAEGRLREAYELSQATNTFPEICGRICPQDRLCEGNCVIEQSGHGTVTIGAVEKYITDTAWDEGWVLPIKPRFERPESVGIVGAGPGGLAAADMLRRRGFQVTVYDRHDRAGGLLVYGIPGFKLEKEVVVRRNGQLEAGGVTFRLDCNVGEDVSFDELRARHDALLIATGVYRSRDLGGPGSGLGGIVRAIDYLTASNRKGFGDAVPGVRLGRARRRRQARGGGRRRRHGDGLRAHGGAAGRDQGDLPLSARPGEHAGQSQREVANAEEEGVDFAWLTAPRGFTGDGTVAGVRVARMRLGAPDATGRQTPEEIPDADYTEPAELVIKALGFEPEELPRLWGVDGLEVTRWGTVKADFLTKQTSLEGVYAAGDIVRGASLVVWAIRDGREAAESIASWLDARSAAVAAE